MNFGESCGAQGPAEGFLGSWHGFQAKRIGFRIVLKVLLDFQWVSWIADPLTAGHGGRRRQVCPTSITIGRFGDMRAAESLRTLVGF